jgi:hypothetical protein
MQVNTGIGDGIGGDDSKEVEAYESRNLRDMRPKGKKPLLFTPILKLQQ